MTELVASLYRNWQRRRRLVKGHSSSGRRLELVLHHGANGRCPPRGSNSPSQASYALICSGTRVNAASAASFNPENEMQGSEARSIKTLQSQTTPQQQMAIPGQPLSRSSQTTFYKLYRSRFF